MSPAFPPPEDMCKLNFSPLRSPSPRRRFNHERNQSEAAPRIRPISFQAPSPMAQQHAKRASIYVSDASIILASPVKTASSLLANEESTAEPIDHYKILEITPAATTDEVKAAYRKLRAVYFSSNAQKYRRLTAAFDVLMDPEARQVYDLNYMPQEEIQEEVRDDDPNWGLKRYQPTHNPMLGSEPYFSYIPLPTQSLPKCRQPSYLGVYAAYALPN
ncbi:DnaJ DnaJ-class molecular chaperone with C-terminal Zn finger domain [Pyrenophora tritici-repentis]|uniref:DnaJ, DnaJ-class molecular chaperone with C-terminal Zn finger domain protein n=1 Tax=Pyrenophora tritici-repentis TaxID=45151 RepID=A0A2W1IAT6_9PLEO|nr:DnaJ, DnaJ-class molecular chaperone with C-terminal Zn finger domain protein [Pyrenophora tritici-repentis]KAI0591346.1 DnaJ DnaJ-class molecular chaperone with C-terminal Zn finger domain protein [Pyrenophora tritici-repentis]KAI0613328.1 DnaJ DnaJ-class molecular chaperone with C-terminal Zn finger domain protein [Pyrenophora tritici-repentis]KAI0627178.1 DnaJ DnaJ-class molecular chaperone with C-terminal Zn finger domain protein [Pyrenophora tritici-repentis]KAI1540105.1 DnaJ DnaJ-class